VASGFGHLPWCRECLADIPGPPGSPPEGRSDVTQPVVYRPLDRGPAQWLVQRGCWAPPGKRGAEGRSERTRCRARGCDSHRPGVDHVPRLVVGRLSRCAPDRRHAPRRAWPDRTGGSTSLMLPVGRPRGARSRLMRADRRSRFVRRRSVGNLSWVALASINASNAAVCALRLEPVRAPLAFAARPWSPSAAVERIVSERKRRAGD
jgi:hypothetical protein